MSKRTAATEKALGELHKLLAESMATQLKAGETSASFLSVVVKFLKDNGIEALPEHSEALKNLSDNLPDLDALDDNEFSAH